MKKRILLILISVTIMFSLIPTAVLGEEYIGITDLSQITDMSGNYKLLNDVETSHVIGDENNAFNGKFDGNGHTVILNLSVPADYVGLFARTTGLSEIKNFKIKNSSVSVPNGYQYSGFVTGYNCGAISNVTITDSSISGYKNIGGITGFNAGEISQCSNENGNVALSYVPSTDEGYGGISGYNSGTITECMSSSNITDNAASSTAWGYFGGIAGENTGDINNCYNSGNLGGTGKGYYIGGICGKSSTAVENCYNIGTISMPSLTKNAVTSGSSQNCYYLDTCNASGTGTSLTAEEFSSLAKNMGDIWEDGTAGYPVLSWESNKYSTTAVKYTVEYYTEELSGDGYTLYISKTFKAEPGTFVTATALDIEGFTFDTDNINNIESGNASSDLVLKLYYFRNNYTLTWDTAGGTINDADYTHGSIKYGSSITAPKDIVRSHYTFIGFNKTIPETMPAYDLKYTAQWEPEMVSVTWDANGGTCPVTEWASESGSYSKVSYGKTYGEYKSSYGSYYYSRSLPVPSLLGKTFAGWYTEAVGGDLITSSTIVTAQEDHTLYAHWADAYTVTFNADGGTFGYGSPSTVDVAQNAAYGDNKIPNVSRTGYIFDGWFDDEGNRLGSNTIINSNITFTAKWTPCNYTVIFNANGGKGNMKEQQFIYGEKKALTQNSFNKTGYMFLGWSTSSYSNDIVYTDGQEVENLVSYNNGTKTLYAVWGEIKHNLTFTTTPADADITVEDSNGNIQESSNGVYELTEGEYNYTISKYGYKNITDTVSLTENANIQVTLEKLPSYDVFFDISRPEGSGEANITLTYGDLEIPPVSSKLYNLIPGNYKYIITASGCNKITGKLTVSDKSITISAIMEKHTGWDGETVSEPPVLNGVYQIASGEELAWFAREVNKGEDGMYYHAALVNDIDLGGSMWTPIGSGPSISYSGTFDGNGHSVKQLNVDGTAYCGLFGYIKGSVKNISVYGEVCGTNYIGGICGYANDATVENCANYAYVASTGSSGHAGGIVGYANGSNINSCLNKADITGTIYTGGIAGSAQYDSIITDCYNISTIHGDKNNAGGITGYTRTSSVINCYNTGYVSTSVSDYPYAGAIVGNKYSGTVTNCYYLSGSAQFGIANNTAISDGVFEKSGDEMKADDFCSLIGPSFIKDIEQINNGYPILNWQLEESLIELNVTDNSLNITDGNLTGAITVNVINNISDSLPGDIILAVYSADGTLKYIKIKHSVLTLENNRVVFDNIKIDNTSSPYTVKIFAWDGINSMKCLSQQAIIEQQK